MKGNSGCKRATFSAIRKTGFARSSLPLVALVALLMTRRMLMSKHSFSRCWLHLTWGTLNRQPLLGKPAAAKVSGYLHEYAESKGIYMKINYVNPDHTHALIDLATKYSIEEVTNL